MKIENNHLQPASFHRANGTNSVNNSGQNTPSEKATRQDRAELSGEARLLSQARSVLQNTPVDEERAARVEQLRNQVETGTYTIPVQDLARKLLERLTGKSPTQE